MKFEMKRTRILFLISSYNVGGFESRLGRFANFIDKEKFEINVLVLLPLYKKIFSQPDYLENHKQFFQWEGVNTEFMEIPSRLHFFLIPAIAKRIKLIGPKCGLFFAVGMNTFLAPLALKNAKVKTIIRLGGTVLNGLYPRPLRFLDKMLLKFVDRTLVPAHFLKNELVQNLSINPESIGVIPNGVPTNILENFDKAVYKRKLGLPEDSKVLGIVANLTLNKAHRYLVKAFKTVLETLPKVYLLIVGDGAERGNLENLAKDLEIEKNILFLGYRKDVSELINCLDVGVLTSEMEIFSNSLLEMAAQSVPIIGSNVGGTPEMIQAGVNGFLFESGNVEELSKHILTLLINDELCMEMGKQARQIVLKSFSREGMMRSYENEILNTIDKKGA